MFDRLLFAAGLENLFRAHRGKEATGQYQMMAMACFIATSTN